MDAALWTLLSGSTAIAAICGQRIFWGMTPQGEAIPALVLTIISGSDQPHLRGTGGLWTYRVQVDCYASHRPQARALSEAVCAALNGAGLENTDGLRGAFVDGTREDFEDSALGRPARISHDFIINWRTP